MTDSIRKKRIIVGMIVLITFAGMVMRILSCFWGYPLALHPDELTIVDNAIDMLRRHSWLAYVYNRPDQFEIKCNAALFSIASRILFRAPAPEAFETHYMAFYVLARGFTALFGTAMIPLASVLAGRMMPVGRQRRHAMLAASVVFSFSPILVEHSAYATPDVVLGFFVLLFTLLLQIYLESGRDKYLWLSVLVMGTAVTVKYPAAILCIPLAAAVSCRCVREKRPRAIIRYGLMSIALMLAVVFVIAPNLFTDFQNAYRTFVMEARPNHLGADGLGWSGNLAYYLTTAVRDLEVFSLLFAAAGIVWALRHPSGKTAVLLIGTVYLVCISALSLHWVQWGLPAYVFYDLLVSLGVAALLPAVGSLSLPVWLRRSYTAGCTLLAVLLGVNLFLSSAAGTRLRTLEDTRSVALRYCIENGINTGNSIFEGYTPLSPNGSAGYRYYAFHVDDGRAYVNEPFAAKKYFVTSDSYSGRFLSESDQYPEEAEVYRAIPDSFELVYRVDGAGAYARSRFAVVNIPQTLRWFRSEIPYTGNTVYIYDLAPELLTVEAATGEHSGDGLRLNEEDFFVVGENPENFILYHRDNGTVSLVLAADNRVLGIDGEQHLVAVAPEAENECEFTIIEKNGGTAFLSDRGALTRDGDKVILLAADEENGDQLWHLIPKES